LSNTSESESKIIIKTHAGLEGVLAKELEQLGVVTPQILKRAVSFNGDNALLYKANYLCYTAIRVLKQIAEFTFTDNKNFYEKINNISWENYLKPHGTLAVDAITSQSEVFNNSHYLARLTKDAIVDRFREKFQTRPNVELNNPDLLVNIHVHKEFCSVSLDSSGSSLHKRGYRKAQIEAPLNEITAAGIIKLTGWKGDTNLFDPMCGSGTLLIEAAMQAMNIPAGYYRNNFAFQKWGDYDEQLYKSICDKANSEIKECDYTIFGADIDKKNLRITRENLTTAKLHHDIELSLGAFEEGHPPFDKGTIIMNPPYGERLPLSDAISFFQTIGNTLKSKYAGYTAWIFAQNNDGLKHIGLRPTSKISLYNGKLECKLLKFEMYEGNKFRDKTEPANI